jgi:hypothetical protein
MERLPEAAERLDEATKHLCDGLYGLRDGKYRLGEASEGHMGWSGWSLRLNYTLN